MKFQNEIIDNNNRFYDTELKTFMRKHDQHCKMANWDKQRLSKLCYLDNVWQVVFDSPTISAKAFLKKYNRKKINFKDLL